VVLHADELMAGAAELGMIRGTHQSQTFHEMLGLRLHREVLRGLGGRCRHERRNSARACDKQERTKTDQFTHTRPSNTPRWRAARRQVNGQPEWLALWLINH
jgi:hypothetical protein